MEHKLRLTPRDLEVLNLVVQDYTSAHIGDKLNLSEQTIKDKRSRMIRKNNVKSLNRVIYLASKRGLL